MSSSSQRAQKLDDKTIFKLGRGVWSTFRDAEMEMDEIYEAAAHWADALKGIERPWLIWNAHDDWCMVQQRLVEAAGWTPVIGYDPRVGPPPLSDKSVLVNFNEKLDLPFLHPVFVLEFIFLFADKLAFWHSDLLIPIDIMKDLASKFEDIQQGQTIATHPYRLSRFWRKPRRFWELVGCSTREASKDQFEKGAGWWGEIFGHINCPSDAERDFRKENLYWDHGTGIKYWRDKYGGTVLKIPVDRVSKGHFSPASYPNLYKRVPEHVKARTRNLKQQLDQNIGVMAACEQMGIDYDKLIH